MTTDARSPMRTEPGLSGAILVCGTASDAGKSTLVTGLCRALVRRGVSVAPFKAQNMSLNSFATRSGHEIGRAQAVQAIASRVEPEPAMNPILLKPMTGHRSQVVVMGRPAGETNPTSYMSSSDEALRVTVLGAFADLRSRFSVVVAEGAGSPAEVNMLNRDLANLWLAVTTEMPAVLVGDIERGGVFASLFGTVAILPPELGRLVRGFVINKFRGDPSLLGPGIEALEAKTGVPVLGVLPYLPGLGLDAEDSLGLGELAHPVSGRPHDPARSDALDVAVVALPHMANFTDLDALRIEPAVSLRLVDCVASLGDPDLLVVPGSKTTVADLTWLRESGLAEAICRAADRPDGPIILGVCAGYQMLGDEIVDDGVESTAGRVGALGLLRVSTVFGPSKTTRWRHGVALGSTIYGYEIRHGEPVPVSGSRSDGNGVFAFLDDDYGSGREGCTARGGRVVGTSLHGLFECDDFRREFLSNVATRRHKRWTPSGAEFQAAREAQIDRTADLVEGHLDLEAVFDLIATAAPGRA